MFCYFNNLQYFHKYLENYKGDSNQDHIYQDSLFAIFLGSCVILIGPENNDGGRHCEPEPLYLQQQCSKEWRLASKFR